MEIQFVDARGLPIADAPVAVSEAPASMRDLGLVTDRQGRVRMDATVAGLYRFVIHVGGRPLAASARLEPGGEAQLKVQVR